MDVLLDNDQNHLPNATATLVLGILSIVTSCGGIGLVLSIVGLVISREGVRMHRDNPEGWVNHGSLSAGRVMCILGLIFNSFVLLFILIYVFVLGAILSSAGFNP